MPDRKIIAVVGATGGQGRAGARGPELNDPAGGFSARALTRDLGSAKARALVPHTDAKGEVDAAFTALGVPTTFLLTSFYWENFIYFGMGPRKGARIPVE